MDVSLGALMLLLNVLRSQQYFVDPRTKASFTGFKRHSGNRETVLSPVCKCYMHGHVCIYTFT